MDTNGREQEKKETNQPSREAMAGKLRIYADEGMPPLERCLACEADGGRHRWCRNLEQPPVKVIVSKDYNLYAPISIRARCHDTGKTRGGHPSASHPPSLKLRRTRARQRSTVSLLAVSIRGPYWGSGFCNKLSSISLDGIGGKRKAISGNRPGGKIRAGSE